MKLSKKIVLLVCILLAEPVVANVDDISDRVCIKNVCTQVETFKSKKLTKKPILLVSIHGDAPFSRPSYHYRFAKRIAMESDNVLAVGLLRPGYTDDFNRTSDGERGDTVGDNYDDARVFQVADAIEKLKDHYKPGKVIIAGHSGGAATTAKLISLRPNIAGSAFVVSCPCNINAWRSDMFKRNQYVGFKGDLNISSPVDLVTSVSANTEITIFVGRDDDITKPYLSKQYHDALVKAGKNATQYLIDGDHGIFRSESVVDAVLKTIKRYN